MVWLLCMVTDVVPVSVLGLNAGRETQGHRFESSSSPIVLADADSYAQQLETEGAVIASFAERREEIARQLAAAAEEGLKPIEDAKPCWMKSLPWLSGQCAGGEI